MMKKIRWDEETIPRSGSVLAITFTLTELNFINDYIE
jgi:hypothetical protein